MQPMMIPAGVVVPPLTLPLDRVTAQVSSSLLTKGVSSYKSLVDLFGLSADQDREAVLTELLADLCLVAALVELSADGLTWLLPEFYACVLRLDSEEAFRVAIMRGTESGAGASAKLSHYQAKMILRQV